jgi:hypothetical protein
MLDTAGPLLGSAGPLLHTAGPLLGSDGSLLDTARPLPGSDGPLLGSAGLLLGSAGSLLDGARLVLGPASCPGAGDGSEWALIGSASATDFTRRDAAPGVRTAYRVQAVRGERRGEVSNVASASASG